MQWNEDDHMDISHCRRIRIATTAFLGLTLLAVVGAGSQALAGGHFTPREHTLTVRFLGDAKMISLDRARWPAVLKERLPSDAVCFRVPIYDASGTFRRGMGINCLSDRVDIGDAITVTNTVFFKMPGGVVVSKGRITAQPVVTPWVLGGVFGGMTHIVGGLPEAANTIKTTRRFKRWKGRVRCSGFVDLTEFDSGKIRMDKIYQIQLRKKPKRQLKK